jgi:hypothetical protein
LAKNGQWILRNEIKKLFQRVLEKSVGEGGLTCQEDVKDEVFK